MSTILQDDQFFNNEVNFCGLYSYEAKKNLEEVFLKYRISYFVEWQTRSFLQKLFRQGYSKKKALCTIRINLADVERAYDFTKDIAEVKYTKVVDKYIEKAGILPEDNLKEAESTVQVNDSFDNEMDAGKVENSFDNEKDGGQHEDGTI